MGGGTCIPPRETLCFSHPKPPGPMISTNVLPCSWVVIVISVVRVVYCWYKAGLKVAVAARPFSVVVTTTAPAGSEGLKVITGLGGEAPVEIALMFDPIISIVSDLASEIGVPETVIAGPPGTNVCPPIMYRLSELAVYVELASVSVGGAAEGFVDEEGVGGAEGTTNVEALSDADAEGRTDDAGAAAAGFAIRDRVLVATIKAVADAASEIGVPDIVIGEPPATKVWVPMI